MSRASRLALLAAVVSTTTVSHGITRRHDRDDSSHRPDPAALEERIEQALGAFDTDATPGAVVLVSRDDHVIAEQAVGMANLEHSIPLTVDSVFHVASDAKRFTAAAVCRLVERGQLKLDGAVSTYLPEMGSLGTRITIEQLLCHTSGLRDQWSLLAMAGWRPEDIVTHDQVVDLLCRQQSTNFPPGDRQMYSNSGYTLLAEIVSRVTGSEFGEFLDREFFAPCGMTRTQVRASVTQVIPGRVESYRRSQSGDYVRRPVQYEVLGATSLLTTASDLARWIEAVHAGDALSPFELETMLEARSLPSGDEMTYAFGLFEHEVHGLAAVGHGGADGGFRSYFLRVPEAGLGIVVLCNTPEIDPNGLSHQIAEWALGDESQPADRAEPAEAGPPDIAGLVGTYRDEAGGMITIRPWFDKLRVWQGAGTPDAFSWRESGGAFVDASGRVLEFEGDRCRLRSEKDVWSGARLADPAIEELSEYEGRYESEELDALFNVRVEDRKLVARSARGTSITLTPAGRDFFDSDTWFCMELRFTRSPDGRIRDMRLSSSRALEISFDRESPQ